MTKLATYSHLRSPCAEVLLASGSLTPITNGGARDGQLWRLGLGTTARHHVEPRPRG